MQRRIPPPSCPSCGRLPAAPVLVWSALIQGTTGRAGRCDACGASWRAVKHPGYAGRYTWRAILLLAAVLALDSGVAAFVNPGVPFRLAIAVPLTVLIWVRVMYIELARVDLVATPSTS